MDDATFSGLKAALLASPRNVELVMVVAREHQARGNPTEAARVVREAGLDLFATLAQKVSAGAMLLGADDAKAPLVVAAGHDPQLLLVQARARAALGDRDEAIRLYQQAVAANPTLEDLDLKALVSATVREVDPGGGKPKMRVISNDETEDPELVRLLQPEQKPMTFADVGGLAEVKKQIERRIILPFQKPSLYEKYKKRVGGGILLYGPPGCGKTLLARATAGECKARFLSVAIHDVLDLYIGESERKLHAIFEKARASTPAVLFFDEIEALGGKRNHAREATSAKLVSLFLTEMDGFAQNNQGVLVLGATNVPWAVDGAFRRPGRFDRVLFVPPPDREARGAILKMLLDPRPVAPGIDVDAIASKTSGFSGADLEHLVESASDEAIDEALSRGEEAPITKQHLERALKGVRSTTLEWLTTARNFARYANEGGQYDEVLEFLDKHGKK
ncbi:MAG: AAA family ATPase [Polyangiaceae bacterium]